MHDGGLKGVQGSGAEGRVSSERELVAVVGELRCGGAVDE